VEADPQVQLRLLDLQALDSGIDRLAVRRRTLPEIADIERLAAALRELAGALDAAEAAKNESARAQSRLEADVDNVRSRAARDQVRLDSGAVSSPRELENLQSEITSLTRRRDILEDDLLELMEAAEAAQARVAELTGERNRAEGERAGALERRDANWAAIDEETVQQRSARVQLAGELPADLVTLYERIRSHSAGVGAARLFRRRCEGCHIELSGSELNDVLVAPPSLLLRCEECRRILVRTEDSGL
jgi:predicted  nucleic acid-binding Zn-ribbon protein